MKNKKLNIWIALGVIFLFVYLAVFGCGGGIKGMRDMRFGIDIRGGVEAVFEPAGTKEKPTKAEHRGTGVYQQGCGKICQCHGGTGRTEYGNLHG